MVFAVYLDVTFEIPDELAELSGALGVEVVDEVAEDIGDDVFAAEGKGGGGGGQVAGVDDAEGGFDEGAGGVGGIDCRGGEAGVTDGDDEGVDGRGVGSGLLHGFEIELEVAEGAAFKLVRLFAEDDLVDEAAAGGEARGDPGDGGAGELGLQGFEEGHEIPYGEDVRLHEETQMLRGADAGVERVRGEAGAEWGDTGFDVCDRVDAGGFGRCAHESIIAGVGKARLVR